MNRNYNTKDDQHRNSYYKNNRGRKDAIDYNHDNWNIIDRFKQRENLELTPKQWSLIWSDSPSEISSSSSESEDDRRKSRKKEKKSKNKKKSRRHSDSDDSDYRSKKRKRHHSDSHKERKKSKKNNQELEVETSPKPRLLLQTNHEDSHKHDAEFGPKPLVETVQKNVRYGGDMMPGEASAIAKYVQENKRIPRRGEVGLTSDEIERYEALGYVMSGSRNQMMNAVRLRKENQVISAEDRKRMALLSHEEKTKKENRLVQQFRDMIKKDD
ncbi:hypothetical protein AKO1_014522 [Acrasis kona]|uniref:NF-kappa-B-activating protein C-terminal domain-containing protein n=1 Tax=Acrasis kona TaxID=1008807 RepID=A0AAW2Z3I3_9EUKA